MQRAYKLNVGDLIHSNRKTIKIKVSKDGDRAFDVIDIETIGVIRLWERIFIGRDVFARFKQRCQSMNGRLFCKKNILNVII